MTTITIPTRLLKSLDTDEQTVELICVNGDIEPGEYVMKNGVLHIHTSTPSAQLIPQPVDVSLQVMLPDDNSVKYNIIVEHGKLVGITTTEELETSEVDIERKICEKIQSSKSNSKTLTYKLYKIFYVAPIRFIVNMLLKIGYWSEETILKIERKLIKK